MGDYLPRLIAELTSIIFAAGAVLLAYQGVDGWGVAAHSLTANMRN